MSDSIENLITQGECMQNEVYEQREWINRAILYLKSELWRTSDCLAMTVESGLGADFDAEIRRKLEEDHIVLTKLLTEVGALEQEAK